MLRFLLIATLLAGCAAGPNELTGTLVQGADAPAGFWLGLWHGIICVVTFIISLFSDNVGVYEVHNKGALYDLGFLLGAGAFASGSTSSSRR
ncbi:MAG: hypothetical protein WC654_04075 [Patescibacteria group bacterium]